MSVKLATDEDWIEVGNWWNSPDEIDLGIRYPIPNYLTGAVDAIGAVRFFQATDTRLKTSIATLCAMARTDRDQAANDSDPAVAEQAAIDCAAAKPETGAAAVVNQEKAPDPELERIGVIQFGTDIAIVISEWKICSVPPRKSDSAEKSRNGGSKPASLSEIKLPNMMKAIARIQKDARIICDEFHRSGLGPEWRRADRAANKLPSLVNFAGPYGMCSLDDWFNLLTLSPAWNGSGTAERNSSLREEELAARICNGLLPDFWHHMPEVLSRRLLATDAGHAMVDAANTARGVRNRNENTSWSVARVGRRSIVRAGSIYNAGNNNVRSRYLNHLYYDDGEITLKTAALIGAQRACLALLRQEIADVARKTDDDFETAASKVQRKLARYATGYFHRSLGLAEQDEFIYRTWRDRLGIDDELEGVTEDVERLHQLAQASRQDKVLAKQEAVADATTKLSMIALLGSLGAVITGIFGMNMAVKTFNNLPLDIGAILLVCAGVLFGSLKVMRKLLPMTDDHTALVFRGISTGSRLAAFGGACLLIAGGVWEMVRPPEPKPAPQEVVCLPTGAQPAASPGEPQNR